jgi:C_GCAxxG_C_C family probable redox protein
VKNVNLQQVKDDAQALFRSGEFYCSEAIVSSICKNVAPEMPEALIAAASGFPVGVGRSKCMRGSVSGAVLCLGYFFGCTMVFVSRGSERPEFAKTCQRTTEKF